MEKGFSRCLRLRQRQFRHLALIMLLGESVQRTLIGLLLIHPSPLLKPIPTPQNFCRKQQVTQPDSEKNWGDTKATPPVLAVSLEICWQDVRSTNSTR